MQLILPLKIPLSSATLSLSETGKQRPEIILREIPFKTGETYLLPDLVKKFEEARRRLMNTTLFHEAIVALKSMEGYNIDITVEVKERWYIFPDSLFETGRQKP